jgi:hypothetical protein
MMTSGWFQISPSVTVTGWTPGGFWRLSQRDVEDLLHRE